MLLAGKIVSLLLVFIFAPKMIFGAIQGIGFSGGNVIFVAIGIVGFITLQWLI